MARRALFRHDAQVAAHAGDLNSLNARIAHLSGGLASMTTSCGEEPRQVIVASLDVLLDMLDLDFAYATFVDPATGKHAVLTRACDSRELAVARGRTAAASNTSLSQHSQAPLIAIRSPAGHAQIARLRLGLDDEIGIIVVGSARRDFPTPTECVLLSVAASQVAIGFRAACLLSEQRRMARELDWRIARQARELERTNEELERALGRLDQLQDSDRARSDVLRERAGLTRSGLAPWQMQRAIKLMTANLQEHVPLAWLAEQCGLSMRHFGRAFRQSTGVPPHRWLVNRRVEHAKELLRNPAMCLVEIALACGFADQSHFTRTFTAVVGVGPGLWRRMESWRLPVGGARTESPAVTNGMSAATAAPSAQIPIALG